MRMIRAVASAVILSIPAAAFGQPPSSQSSASLVTAQSGGGEWIEFASREDRFTCNFPGRPTERETTWTSDHGAVLPARVYTAVLGPSRYSMTVVDYRGVEKVLTEKSKSCPAGAETCRGGGGATGLGYWKIDLQGAPTYALWKLLQRDVKLTHLTWNQMGMVGGDLLQLTNTADNSRTFASIYMHENRLYIMEGTVPAGSPPPGLFQQSLGWLDEQGNGIRYQQFYLHGAARPSANVEGSAQAGQPR